MTEEMIGRNHHKEKKINFHSIGVIFILGGERDVLEVGCRPRTMFRLQDL
jgi:hypothetical protein